MNLQITPEAMAALLNEVQFYVRASLAGARAFLDAFQGHLDDDEPGEPPPEGQTDAEQMAGWIAADRRVQEITTRVLNMGDLCTIRAVIPPRTVDALEIAWRIGTPVYFCTEKTLLRRPLSWLSITSEADGESGALRQTLEAYGWTPVPRPDGPLPTEWILLVGRWP